MTNDEWSALTAGTASLTSLVTSGEGKTEFVRNTGLRISLAEVNRQFPPSETGVGLSIYADTVVFDDPTFNAKGVSIIARCADVSLFRSAPVILRPETVACVVIVGETMGGALKFNTEAKPDAAVTVPTGIDDIQPFLLNVAAGGEAVGSKETQKDALPNWLGRPAALNSLKASFTAAALLIEKGDPKTIPTARSMLRWVISCCASLEAVNATDASFVELGTQASALMITINVRDGVRYAPALSADYYKNKISGLITALASYEDQIRSLDVQTDIKKAIDDVTSVLEQNSASVAGAYEVQLQGINENIQSLMDGVRTLERQYMTQSIVANSAWVDLQVTLADDQLKRYFTAVFETVTGAVKTGMAVKALVAPETEGEPPDPSELKNVAEGSFEAINGAYKAINVVLEDAPDAEKDLLDAASKLLAQQDEMTASVLLSHQLWEAVRGKPTVKLDVKAGVVSVDPRIAWQNYIDAAEARLRTQFSDTEQKQEASVYATALKALTQFGMGVDANLVALTSQFAEGVAVTARLRAEQSVTARWEELKKKSQSDEDQLIALKGLVTSQASAVRSSVFASFRLYASAFFYLNLRQPPEKVSLSMTSAQLTSAFNAISTWTEWASDRKINLPNNNVELSLNFPIVTDRVGADGDVAVMTPATGDTPAKICFGFPIGSSQLQGVLPHGGNVAIWITKAEVFIDGVMPNSKKNVLFTLSTSGAYLNGFGPQQAFAFVNGGVSGSCAYNTSSGQNKVYDSWIIPTLVYATPTPYTQWEIAMEKDGGDPSSATSVQMSLVVAYEAKS